MFMFQSFSSSSSSSSSAPFAGRRVIACLMAVVTVCLLCLSPAADARGVPPASALQIGEASVSDLSALFPAPTEGAVKTSAHAHILMEAESGCVLDEKRADERLPMASTTKIMTALVAISALPCDTVLRIPREAVGIEGSSVYLTEGEELTLEQLLYALLLESANDAAVAIALKVGGSVEGFADMMNQKAQEMGLKDTHFCNPHGLDDPDHYTTARELALIAKEALKEPTLRTIISTVKKTIPLRSTEGVRLLINHNRMLRQYDGCIGIKTGYTKRTGRCLVSAAERDGVTLIAVTLGAPDDWRDHTALLDHGFSLLESRTLALPGAYRLPLWVETGDKEYVMVSNTDGLTVTLPKGTPQVSVTTELPRFLFAAVGAGVSVGQIVFSIEGEGGRISIGTVPLRTEYAVQKIEYKHRFGAWLRDHMSRRS